VTQVNARSRFRINNTAGEAEEPMRMFLAWMAGGLFVFLCGALVLLKTGDEAALSAFVAWPAVALPLGFLVFPVMWFTTLTVRDRYRLTAVPAFLTIALLGLALSDPVGPAHLWEIPILAALIFGAMFLVWAIYVWIMDGISKRRVQT
jgi:hypothetical protein